MKNYILILVLLIGSNFIWAQDTVKVIILHTNDTHGSIDNYSKIKYIADSIRTNNNNVFFVSAGDIFSGNPYVDKYPDKGFPMIDLMNDLHYDASEFGNHEFDYGQQYLAKRINQAKFDFLCSNANTKNTVIPQPKPFKIFYTTDSIKIFMLGVLQIGKNGLPDTHPDKVKNIIFTKPAGEIKKYQKQAKKYNCFILLSHLGIKTDEKTAKKYKFINTIIGGHSHTTLTSGEKIKNTFITQTGSRLKNLGILTLYFIDKKLVLQTDTLINLKNYKNFDKILAKKIQRFKANKTLSEVVGKTNVILTAPEKLGYLMSLSQKEITKADFAFQNTGGIRLDTIKKGNITRSDIYNLDPFDNEIYIFDLTEKQIKSFIKYAYNIHKENNLIAAGIQLKLTVKNKKLKKIELFGINNKPLEKTKTYKVAINSYMASSYKFNGKNNFIKSKKTSNQALFLLLKNKKYISKNLFNNIIFDKN